MASEIPSKLDPMGSTSDRGDDTRDWKNGSVHMRIESHEARKSDSGKADEAVSADDSRNSTDDTNANSTARASGSRRQFPRLGLDALLHESQPSARPNEDGTFQFYKVYKRRWLGLAQLTLLNIIISWDVSLVLSTFPAAGRPHVLSPAAPCDT